MKNMMQNDANYILHGNYNYMEMTFWLVARCFCASLQFLDDQIKNKDMLIAFFDSQGIIYWEFVSSRQTVDRVLLWRNGSPFEANLLRSGIGWFFPIQTWKSLSKDLILRMATIRSTITTVLKTISKKDFRRAFQRLYERWPGKCRKERDVY